MDLKLTEMNEKEKDEKQFLDLKENEKKIKEVDEESENEEIEDDKKKLENGDENKKKKKKKKSKKTKPLKEEKESFDPVGEEISLEELRAETQTNERFRCLGGWPSPAKFKFPNNQFEGYPANEIQEYNVPRVKIEEIKAKEMLIEEHLQNLRKAAEVQRQVRRFAQRIIKPGRKLIDICEELENLNRKLAPENGLKSGIAFPTGCSLNNVAAHFSPNPGDTTVLTYDDVMKVDFGTHINGRIIDTAFTVAFNPTYDKLLEAVKEAAYAGIKFAGIDARIGELGALMQETMESYEVEINGKIYPVKAVRSLTGHSIDPYRIHAGKYVPCVKTNTTAKMEEGESYAIEPFGSTGSGYLKETGDCSHYMKEYDLPANVKIPPRSRAFYNLINEKFDTLAFCRRWLERLNFPAYILPLKDLVSHGIINACPPLADIKGSYVAQWEHTLILRPLCKEVLSRGDDY